MLNWIAVLTYKIAVFGMNDNYTDAKLIFSFKLYKSA